MRLKFWALLLAAMMIATMMPVSGFAAQGDRAPDSTQQITRSSAEKVETETLEDGDVQINKSITGTDTENVFNITLDVTTAENLKEIPTGADAAVVLVVDRSGSMNDTVSSSQGSKTRYQAAVAAAENFAAEFGKDAQGFRRLVQIAQFSNDAVKKKDWNWENVADASGLTACKADIKDINKPDGGTNIEGGLQLAYNLITQADRDGILKEISNVNVILLTDGCPTFHVDKNSRNSTETVKGIRGGGNWATWEDHNSVTKQGGIADKIKNLELNGGKVSLYSIAFSTGTDKFAVNDENEYRKAKNQDVYEWLRSFSSKAFKSDNQQDLFDSFSKIVKIIKLGAQAWYVHDPMAPNIIYEGNDSSYGENAYSFSDNKLTWDLKNSEPISEAIGNKTYYHYTFTYPVALDTTGSAFTFNKEMATNGATILDYLMFSKSDEEGTVSKLKQADFDVPEVKGLCGSLEFMKADDKGNPVKGAGFTLKGTAVGNGKPVTMTADSGADGTVTFANIPSGTYKLKETKVPAGYTGDATEYDVKVSYGKVTSNLPDSGKVTNTREKTTIAVAKKWIDGGNQEALRPDSIKVQLKANGAGAGDAITLNADNGWSYEWKNLDKYSYNAEGVKENAISYTVGEVDVPEGYAADVSGDAEKGFVITNTIEQKTVTVKGTKIWKDPEGTEHPTITINLLQDGVEIDDVELPNGKTEYAFTGLDKYDPEDGHVYEYTVTEDPVDGYTTDKSGNNFTNTIDPGNMTISGVKTWIAPEGTKYPAVKITLLQNGTEYKSVELANGETEYRFDVPVYDGEGQPYKYDIREADAAGYTSKVDGYNVINTIKQESVDVAGTKTWIAPEGTEFPNIKIDLCRDGNVIDSVELKSGESKYSFRNLDKYDLTDGHIYEYTVREQAIEEYSASYDGYDITNTIDQKYVTVSGTKTWVAPEGTEFPDITVNLLKNGEEIDEVVLENGTTDFAFDNLEQYSYSDDGVVTVNEYTITEDAVNGYKSTIKGYNITNTKDSETVIPHKPKTGDEFNMWIFAALASAAAIGAGAAAFGRRHRQR